MFPYGYRQCLYDAADSRPKRKTLGGRNIRRVYKKKERGPANRATRQLKYFTGEMVCL